MSLLSTVCVYGLSPSSSVCYLNSPYSCFFLCVIDKLEMGFSSAAFHELTSGWPNRFLGGVTDERQWQQQ